MVRRLGEPVIRTAVAAAMREMGEQFVLGRTIDGGRQARASDDREGLSLFLRHAGRGGAHRGGRQRYFRAYADAISSLDSGTNGPDIRFNPGISVKLSALHPRYEQAQKEKMLPVMAERLMALALAARHARMGLNIDAEEADRLDLSLDVIERVLAEPELAGWNGFGVVVQAYGPRAAFVIDWLYALARRLDRQIMVRLVKGAYWDTEIKRAQMLGLSGFPVFTRKVNTDVSYIACARKLLSDGRPHLSAVRHPQCAHGGRRAGDGDRPRQFRVPAPARHGRATARGGPQRGRHALPHLCAGRRAFRPAWPIWCGACSKTAPTRPSSTSSPMQTCRPRKSRATRSRWSQSQGQAENPAIATPAAIFGSPRSELQGLRRHRSGDAGRDRQSEGCLCRQGHWSAKPITRAAGLWSQAAGRQSRKPGRYRRHRDANRAPSR